MTLLTSSNRARSDKDQPESPSEMISINCSPRRIETTPDAWLVTSMMDFE
ncbi:MAG: hypothetical protein WCJ99_00570 [Betaproteobacteria bacterium]